MSHVAALAMPHARAARKVTIACKCPCSTCLTWRLGISKVPALLGDSSSRKHLPYLETAPLGSVWLLLRYFTSKATTLLANSSRRRPSYEPAVQSKIRHLRQQGCKEGLPCRAVADDTLPWISRHQKAASRRAACSIARQGPAGRRTCRSPEAHAGGRFADI